MASFHDITSILDDSVGGDDIGAHRAFWRDVTRDEFVDLEIFGFDLLVVGQGAQSNLVKALKGEPPFGADLPNPPSGALFSRMPSGRPPVSNDDIAIIQNWIDDGCPEVSVEPDSGHHGSPIPIEPFEHLALWREFDRWAMFSATTEVNSAIGVVFGLSDLWRAFARDPDQEAEWLSAIEEASARLSIELLAEKQFQTFTNHFGSPLPMDRFLDAFERFGDNSLPDDIERPQDVRHNMNGPGMWQMWSAFADACIHLSIRESFWGAMGRGILLGQLNDGLFRGRFTVNGFERSVNGKVAMRDFITNLSDADVTSQLRERFVDSGLG